MKRSLALSFALLTAPAALLAQDQAILLGVDRYEQLGRISGGDDLLDASEALTELGFEVSSLRNPRSEAATEALTGWASSSVGWASIRTAR